jgi:hypothetical protein
MFICHQKDVVDHRKSLFTNKMKKKASLSICSNSISESETAHHPLRHTQYITFYSQTIML